jgi:D-alanyl-D-alanine endopeptidase (penicillin-binding protein 7)
VVLDAEQSLDEKIEITRDDRASDRGGPSRLAAGTVLSRGDLLHLALMSSENRAAYAVGRSYPGGLDALLSAMNAKAKALGMRSAHFSDPTGLSSENVASPSDLSKLVMAASRNPTIRSYSTDPEHAVAVGRGKVEFRNTNNLVRNKDWDIVVQKTGYTEAAGRCLVMKTVVNDRPVVIVLMNSFGKYTRVADAARIRRWIETGHPQAITRSAMVTQPKTFER